MITLVTSLRNFHNKLTIGKEYRVIGWGQDTYKVLNDLDRSSTHQRDFFTPAYTAAPQDTAPAPKPVALVDDQGQFIVVLAESDDLTNRMQLRPNDKPKVHTSRSAAEVEAGRMAELHQGSRFLVMQATYGIAYPKPVKVVPKITRLV
jgi:hypothetical protein